MAETEAGTSAGSRLAEWAEVTPFVWRTGGFNKSPIAASGILPTIHGDNVALGHKATKTIRRLMPSEVEQAFTFSPTWTAGGADGKVIRDSPRYKMLETAVPPAIVEWIGMRLLALIKN